jgi:hypothetical protein
MMKSLIVLLLASFLSAGVWAKLPELTEEQKAAAAEKKAKADEATKKGNEQLAASQDQVAGRYIEQMKAKGITVTPTRSRPRPRLLQRPRHRRRYLRRSSRSARQGPGLAERQKAPFGAFCLFSLRKTRAEARFGTLLSRRSDTARLSIRPAGRPARRRFRRASCCRWCRTCCSVRRTGFLRSGLP